MSSFIGIDFGSSYSAVAFTDEKGRPKALPDSEDPQFRVLLPSMVAVQSDGMAALGWQASDLRIHSPSKVISSVKRLIGKSLEQAAKEDPGASLVFEMDEHKRLCIRAENRLWTPVEIASLILRALKLRAETFLGGGILSGAVSVPGRYLPAQRDATLEAAKMAGIPRPVLVDEAVAACYAYGLHERKSGRYAVYDMGGSAFDICLIECRDGGFTVLAESTEPHLGGDDIDWRLAEKFLSEIERQYGLAAARDLELKQAVVDEAERAKRAVSHRGSYDIHVRDARFQVDYRRALSRFEMEEMVGDIVKKTADICTGILRQSGLRESDLDGLIFVGGSTRIPRIAETARRIFGTKVYEELNPDEVLALGAAVFARLEYAAEENKNSGANP